MKNFRINHFAILSALMFGLKPIAGSTTIVYLPVWRLLRLLRL